MPRSISGSPRGERARASFRTIGYARDLTDEPDRGPHERVDRDDAIDGAVDAQGVGAEWSFLDPTAIHAVLPLAQYQFGISFLVPPFSILAGNEFAFQLIDANGTLSNPIVAAVVY